jgi:hypothetical protein
MKRPWIKPELTVFVRNTSDENLLDKCKDATHFIGFLAESRSTNNSSHYNSSCMQKFFSASEGGGETEKGHPKFCRSCWFPNIS